MFAAAGANIARLVRHVHTTAMNEHRPVRRAVCQWTPCSPYAQLIIHRPSLSAGPEIYLVRSCFSTSYMGRHVLDAGGFAILDSSWPYSADEMRRSSEENDVPLP